MKALYLASVEEAAGKTALCAGIGRQLLDENRKVAFLKPVAITLKPGADSEVDRDTNFIATALEVEGVPSLNLTRQALLEALEGTEDSLGKKVQQAYAQVSAGKDVVILEGLSGLGRDEKLTQAALKIVGVTGARVIMVLRYSTTLPWAEVATSKGKLGDNLIGIVINCVPETRIESIREVVEAQAQKEGIRVLGVLPQSRTLAGISVGELADRLGGEIVACPQGSGGLVENIMIGAMCLDPGPQYFARKPDKAVIVRGERPDIQLAALETSTRCLVLSGGKGTPSPHVLYRAEDKGVPIIVAESDTLAIVDRLGDALNSARFCSEAKLRKVGEILRKYFDSKALHQELGLAG